MNNIRTQSTAENVDLRHSLEGGRDTPEYPFSGIHSEPRSCLGYWYPGENPAAEGSEALLEALRSIYRSFFVLLKDCRYLVGSGGTGRLGETAPESGTLPIYAYSPAIPLENLGDHGFCRDHGIQYPYIGGSMAHGISSVEIVEALGRGGMLGFFGVAGLPPRRIQAAVDRLQETMGTKPYGFNLIHSPNEPQLETQIAEMYIRKGVHRVEASAFLDITLPVVRYRVYGIHLGPDGNIITPNQLIAKVSRVEVASKFFSPPPEKYLQELVELGDITKKQAELARQVPLAQDITAEADSGGHTDSRPAISLLPTMLALRDAKQREFEYCCRLRVGLAGGISTPLSTAAAFAMGAAYVVTGSVNQACIESGTSPAVRELLAQVQQADVILAPAADMFEMNAKVQVLKRGTMFPMRAAKLAELYRIYNSIDEIPPAERIQLEKTVFRASFDEIWNQTVRYFQERDTTQLDKASDNPKYKLALTFRWYLGQASHWAITGNPDRKIDYQIWCGPAMGAFNEWTKGSFLEHPQNRQVVSVALNLLHGAAVLTRINTLRSSGIYPGPEFNPVPLEEPELSKYLIK
ncbi:MAG: PfaD family polyunsaturated fatty acid/polyketide biosynthesis protein [Firmicutes bacterium]|nr:PfaD family polyunsaturated fatty acid/polyketide biosynthesis protein [Bacillota bacterium]